MNHEQLLRDTLTAKAAEASVGLTFDDVRHGASRHRSRSRRRTVAVLAAAAALLVGVPAAMLLRPAGDDVSPAPSPSPTHTTPSPSPDGLAGIPRGRDLQVAYLRGREIHEPDGTASRLPYGSSFVARFTVYHGGWLLLDDVGGLRQYDGRGGLVRRSTTGESALAVSADRMRTAFLVDGHLHVGITTGMGEGETDQSVGVDARPVGFLGDRVVLNGFPGAPRAVDPSTGRSTLVPGLEMAWCTAATGDLVGGTVDGDRHGRVVSTSGGRTLWTSDWIPEAFSPDGTHVLAVSSTAQPDSVAILDARTGAVLSQLPLVARGLTLAASGVWEPAGDAVVLVVHESQGAQQQAVLRLDLGGAVTRATDAVPAHGDTPGWIFAAQP